MNKPRIAIDLDDVLGVFVDHFLEWHNERYCTSFCFEDVYTYDFSKWLETDVTGAFQRVGQYYDEALLKIKPTPGAQRTLVQLSKKYECHVVTARVEERRAETVQCRHYPGIFSEVHFTGHYTANARDKGEVCNEIGAVALIDNALHNALSGVAPGRKVFLLDKPWNKNVPSEGMDQIKIKRVFTWQEIERDLM